MLTGEQYSDLLELHFLEITKVPPVMADEKPSVQWIRFLGGSNREELKAMSERNEYIQCAYEELERLSQDRQKRLEYETRQKNIRDYNSQMKSARIQGEEIGMQKGKQQGKQQAEEQILALGKALQRAGRSEEAIKAMTDEKYLKKLLKEFGVL